MPATAIPDVQGLRRRFGSTEAVGGVDLRVTAGETVALLGPNGAGKSTMLAMILGLVHRRVRFRVLPTYRLAISVAPPSPGMH